MNFTALRFRGNFHKEENGGRPFRRFVPSRSVPSPSLVEPPEGPVRVSRRASARSQDVYRVFLGAFPLAAANDDTFYGPIDAAADWLRQKSLSDRRFFSEIYYNIKVLFIGTSRYVMRHIREPS